MNPSDYYKINIDVFKEKESAFLDYLKKLVGREITDQEIKDAIINSNFNFARCLIEHDYEAGELAYRLLIKHYMQLNLNDLSFEIEGEGQYKITRTSDFNYPTYRKKVDEVEKWQHVFEIAKKSPLVHSLMSTNEGFRYLLFALPCRKDFITIQGRTLG